MPKFIVACSIVAVMTCSCLVASEDDMKAVDGLIARLPRCTVETIPATGAQMARLLYESDSDSAFRRAVVQKLAAAYGSTTPEGRMLLYRLLLPYVSGEAVGLLAPFVVSDRDDGEEGQLAVSILEFVPDAKVDAVFIDALGKTTGLRRVALIAALARRRVVRAVPDIVPLVKDGDGAVAVAAIRALGSLATDEAVVCLRELESQKSYPVEVRDAILRVGEAAPSFSPQAEIERVTIPTPDERLVPIQKRYDETPDLRKKLDILVRGTGTILQTARPSVFFAATLRDADSVPLKKGILEIVGKYGMTDDLITLAVETMNGANNDVSVRSAAALAAVHVANRLRRFEPVVAKERLRYLIGHVGNADIRKRAEQLLNEIK